MSSRIFKKTNNPLNIRFVAINHWRGSVGEYAGFVMFSDVYYGLRAAIVLLNRYIKHGYDTPAKIISRWAPASENNTSNYIKYVCFHAGFTRDIVISYKSDSFGSFSFGWLVMRHLISSIQRLFLLYFNYLRICDYD